jgi:hypothetical protein
MTFNQELNSWFSPSGPEPAEPPALGQKAPETPKLNLTPGRPTVITFLRHCGCPFAEKSFLNLRDIAKEHYDVDFVAVSHSDEASTETWLQSLPQASNESSNLRIVVDDKLELYTAWGLGISGWAHALSPFSLYSVWKMGREEGIWNRPTESGSRWQTAGSYAVDREGIVRWGKAAERADDIPDFEDAVGTLLGDGTKAAKL